MPAQTSASLGALLFSLVFLHAMIIAIALLLSPYYLWRGLRHLAQWVRATPRQRLAR